MKLVGQFAKIIEMSKDGAWHCRAEWWPITKSPHKRRSDLEAKGYFFEERTCTHGIINSKDFRLVDAPKKREQIVTQLPDGRVRVEYKDVPLFQL